MIYSNELGMSSAVQTAIRSIHSSSYYFVFVD